MTHIHHLSKTLTLGLLLALISGSLLLWSAQAGYAGDRGHRPGEFRDARHNHNHVYPVHGHIVRTLPREHRAVVHGGARYYFHGGVWYRPHGPRFTVVAPPFGLFVPFLPPYYATVWVGGTPYYYANQVYYVRQGDGYVVAEAPQGEVSQTPPPVVSVMPPEAQPIPVPPPPAPPMEKLFIYPRQNQSEQQQATDRYECHKWAVSQTGFDPTQLAGGPPDDPRGQKRADYSRAMSACLEGRGYTVR